MMRLRLTIQNDTKSLERVLRYGTNIGIALLKRCSSQFGCRYRRRHGTSERTRRSTQYSLNETGKTGISLTSHNSGTVSTSTYGTRAWPRVPFATYKRIWRETIQCNQSWRRNLCAISQFRVVLHLLATTILTSRTTPPKCRTKYIASRLMLVHYTTPRS